MKNLYKKIKKLIAFLSLKNIWKSICNPKKAIYFLKFYAKKAAEDDRIIEEITVKFFPEKIEKLKTVLKELSKSPVSNIRFSSGRSGYIDTVILYVISRLLKPENVIETGVASGKSSSFILQALHNNNYGNLYSIELPKLCPPNKDPNDPSLLINVEGNVDSLGYIPSDKEPGWLIPENLRSRWSLILGTSSEELPKLVEKLRKINLFYHDSEHTYKNMFFEFKTVWPHLEKGGFLLSDDIQWNEAFNDFTKELKPSEAEIYKYDSMGIIKKL